MLEFIRGDTETISINFKNNNNEDYTPSFVSDGDTLTFTAVRRDSGDIVLQKTIKYPTLDFNFTHNETDKLPIETLKFDIEYSKPDRSKVKTLVIDLLKVIRDITRGTVNE